MFKKLSVFICVSLFVLASGGVMAAQIDGMASSGGPPPPAELQDLHVNPGGLGDALIFGYYNARNSLNLIRLVNTNTQDGVVGKLRFREGEYSEEVLDFLVCLSPGDQFTVWVVDPEIFGLGAGPALLIKGDAADNLTEFLVGDGDTITVPDQDSWDSVYFKYSATGAADTVSRDDTKEGYFEFIATKGIKAGGHTGWLSVIENSDACADFALNAQGEDQIDTPNSLMGSVFMFNFNTFFNSTYAYDATALANFATIIDGVGTTTDEPLWVDATAGLLGVNYVLTKRSLYGMYDVQDYLAGATDYIVTFPTKKEILEAGLTSIYFPHDDVMAGHNCTQIMVKMFDDEEDSPSTETGFSPGKEQKDYLCCEVNYIGGGVDSARIFDTSLNFADITNIGKGKFDIGWVNIQFLEGETSATNSTTVGMPCVAYELQGYCDSYLSHMLPMKYDVVTGP
jgi:hypothetical protein